MPRNSSKNTRKFHTNDLIFLSRVYLFPFSSFSALKLLNVYIVSIVCICRTNNYVNTCDPVFFQQNI